MQSYRIFKSAMYMTFALIINMSNLVYEDIFVSVSESKV